jgi:P27 family predicted phage terminase small subunit
LPQKQTLQTHVRNGTYRADRHTKTGLSYPPSDGRPPRWLDKAAKAEWKRVAPLLMAEGKLLMPDESVLASYCSAVSGYQDCLRQIQEHGQTQTVTSQTRTGSSSRIVKHPAVQLLFEHQRVMLQTASHFGFTPLSRERITGEMPDDGEQELQPTFSSPVTPEKPTKRATTHGDALGAFIQFPNSTEAETKDE